MNIFSRKIEMNQKIREQEDTIQRLKTEKDKFLKDIAELKDTVNTLSQKNAELKDTMNTLSRKNAEYETKYMRTNLECDFCYTTIQESFIYCPKCGKKIEKTKITDNKIQNTNPFQTEEDCGYVCINRYNVFSIRKITIPANINGKPVSGICDELFEAYTELEEVVFEEGCKYIGKSAFANCTNLKKVKLPKSLVEIGDSAFRDCVNLEEIAIPPNVKSIGSQAFSRCRQLKKIVLPENLEEISVCMLSDTAIKDIVIPQSVTNIYFSAFSNTNLTEVELPVNLYSISNHAFDIPSLKKITIYANTKFIDKDIFGKSSRPTICCEAGSKAHLFARMYGMQCVEISSPNLSDKPMDMRN